MPNLNVSFDIKGCISHFMKWHIHLFIYKETIIMSNGLDVMLKEVLQGKFHKKWQRFI